MDRVPKQEIEGRIQAFQSILDDKDLDGAFILQNVDIYYFSGTLQRSVLFIPREGNPLLMAIKSYNRAREESPLKAVVPIKTSNEIVPLLSECGHTQIKTLGLEMDVLPTNQYLWYQRCFPNSRWIDVSPQIRRLRMIKSPYEVEQVRKATAILDKGLKEIRGIIRKGMTELEVDGYLALIARREGHMGILRMRGWNQEMTYAHVLSGGSGAVVSFCDTPHGGSGNTPAMAQGAGFRRIRRNEPIGIDYGIGINGYLSDQFRTFVIGSLPQNLERAHECTRGIHDLMVAEAKPGISCPDLYHMAETEAKSAGYGDFFMGYGEGKVKFIGHGLGLEIDEYPILTPEFPEKLQTGMVIALEPKFIFPEQGVVGLEDDYLVTPSGLERLTLTDQTIMTIENNAA
jgi:Xaa-Pro dipeptidase